jgi:hypothetical protein
MIGQTPTSPGAQKGRPSARPVDVKIGPGRNLRSTGTGIPPGSGRKPTNDFSHRRKILIVAVVMVIIVLTGVFIIIYGLFVKNDAEPTSESHETKSYSLSMVDEIVLPEDTGYIGAYIDKVKINLSEEKHNEDGTGSANVTVSTPDLRIIFDELWAKVADDPSITSEQMDQWLVEQLSAKNCQISVSEVIPVQLKLVDSNWKIVPNDEFKKAVTGDANIIYEEFLTKVMDKEAKK